MNSKRTLARDRRLAAVHEAGHVVIARRLGIEISSAWITPNEGGAADERTWIGRVQIFRPGEKGERARRMIGVAGAVIEHLWCGGWIEDFFPDEMSESDWKLAGCPPDEPDDALMDAIEEVGRIMDRAGPGWLALVAEARRLIIESRPSA